MWCVYSKLIYLIHFNTSLSKNINTIPSNMPWYRQDWIYPIPHFNPWLPNNEATWPRCFIVPIASSLPCLKMFEGPSFWAIQVPIFEFFWGVIPSPDYAPQWPFSQVAAAFPLNPTEVGAWTGVSGKTWIPGRTGWYKVSPSYGCITHKICKFIEIASNSNIIFAGQAKLFFCGWNPAVSFSYNLHLGWQNVQSR